VITSQRMLFSQGLVTKKVNMMPLSKVTDMSFQRSTLGRILGHGEFILESAGQDQALRIVDRLPYPEQLYLEVCGLIFRDKEHYRLPGATSAARSAMPCTRDPSEGLRALHAESRAPVTATRQLTHRKTDFSGRRYVRRRWNEDHDAQPAACGRRTVAIPDGAAPPDDRLPEAPSGGSQ
jgi:hypothetical protein